MVRDSSYRSFASFYSKIITFHKSFVIYFILLLINVEYLRSGCVDMVDVNIYMVDMKLNNRLL